MCSFKKRSDYTYEERMTILRYIIDNEKYLSLRGNALWQEMENNEICPQHTWQSLKEHFLKKIISSINYFDITEDERKRILHGFQSTSRNKKKKPIVLNEAVLSNKSSTRSFNTNSNSIASSDLIETPDKNTEQEQRDNGTSSPDLLRESSIHNFKHTDRLRSNWT